ncbi:hypothetical protein KBY22_09925 [Ruegeria pomeroyi]|nr:hypothetical protein [Ruegeria pomeroyi]
MNGLLRPHDGSPQAPAKTGDRQQLENLLRNTSSDAKVIFGASRGVFDLNRSAIENFFHLVDQRVCEQNNCGASVCEFAVYYNDGTSRKFPSVDDFRQYSETRKRHPTVLTLHLSYFITFPGGEQPERQEIDILIQSSEILTETLDMVANDSQFRMSGDKVQMMARSDDTPFGVISYTINHTRISWGLDLEGHIKSHIDTVLEPPSFADSALHWSAGPLNLFTTIFVGLYLVNLLIDAFFRFLYATDGASTPSQTLEIAANYLVNGQIAKYIVASLVVSAVFFVIFSAFISRLTKSLKKPKPSFIVLCDNDAAHREKKLIKYRKRWTRFAATILLDIAVAVMIFFLEDRITPLFSAGSGG